MRHSFAALAICLCLAASFAAPAPLHAADGPDVWLGKRVTVKNPAAKLTENGKPLSTRIYLGDNFEVTKVAGEELFVGRGWIKASDVVLYDQAINYFTAQLAHDPTARAYHERAVVYRKGNEYDLATVTAGTSFRFNPENGDFDRAIADEDKAIQLNPKYVDAYFNRGIARAQKMGDDDQAIADFSEAIRLDANDARFYNARGAVLLGKREWEKAVADYDKAIRRDTTNPVFYVNRGDVCAITGEFGKAVADYSEAIRLDPDYTEAIYKRAQALAAEGEVEDAIVDFLEVLGEYPRGQWEYDLTTYGERRVHFKIYGKLDCGFSSRDESNYKNRKSARGDADAVRPAGVDDYLKKGTVLGDPADYDKPLAKVPGISQIAANKAPSKNVVPTPPIANGGGDAGKPAAVELKKGSDAAAK